MASAQIVVFFFHSEDCIRVAQYRLEFRRLRSRSKHYTALPRPFALAMFGGYLQLPTDFWALAGQPGGGALPSVHAAVGYSVFSLYFAGWALNNRRLRWLGLASGLILGSFFGALRILQDRKSVVWGKGVSGRVDLGVRLFV